MLYINWSPDPILIDLGFFALRWYSLLFALGIFMSYIIFKRRFKLDGIPLEKLEKLTVYIVIGVVAGARIGHCLFYDPSYYLQNPLEIFLPVRFNPEFEIIGFRGLASHGGALGILIALLLFVRKHKMNLWYLLDIMGIGVPVTAAFIRLANLMNSEIIGDPSEVPWAFVFTEVDMIPRHPGQLYEALCYLLIFAAMALLRKTFNKMGQGILFGCFLLLLFLARFLLEFTKQNQVSFEDSMQLNMGQWLSLPFIAAGIVIILIRRNKTGSTTEP